VSYVHQLQKDNFRKNFFLRYLLSMWFKRVLFCYVEWQDACRQLQYEACVKKKKKGEGVEITQIGLPKKKENIIEFREGLSGRLFVPFSPKLIIIYDLKRELSSSETIMDLFTKGSHHKNFSVILITKSLLSGTRATTHLSTRIIVFKIFAIALKFDM